MPRRYGIGAAVCVVMASEGYPGKYEKNKVIYGLEKTKEMENCFVFHAGTAFQNDRIVTSGQGSNLTAWDFSLENAVKRAYDLTGRSNLKGCITGKILLTGRFNEIVRLRRRCCRLCSFTYTFTFEQFLSVGT